MATVPNQRDDESDMEYARRLIDEGHPDERIEVTLSLPADILVKTAEPFPNETPAPDVIRAQLLTYELAKTTQQLPGAETMGGRELVAEHMDNLETDLDRIADMMEEPLEIEVNLKTE